MTRPVTARQLLSSIHRFNTETFHRELASLKHPRNVSKSIFLAKKCRQIVALARTFAGGSVTEGFANDLPGNGTTTSKLDSSI